MSNVAGYFNSAVSQAPAQGPASPYYSDASTPADTTVSAASFSSTDEYVSGLRSGAAALAAMRGAKNVATMARWNTMAKAASIADRGAANATAMAGGFRTASQVKSQMAQVKTLEARAAWTSRASVGVGSSLRYTLFSVTNIARALASSALVAVPMAVVSNFLDWQNGRITAEQRNTLMIADAIGYTATGAGATLVGGALGATFLGTGLGTIAGIACGLGLGYAYEKFLRPSWTAVVSETLRAQGGMSVQ